MSRMRVQVVAVAALLITLGAGITKADTITTGDLSFLCRADCVGGTLPTGSSFTYDHGLLSLEVTWDNVEWFWNFGSFSKDYYRSLTGQGNFKTVWVAECIVGSADLPGHCGDNGIYFYFFQVRGCLDATCNSFTPNATLRDQIDFASATAFGDMVPDGASGTATANVFKSHAINFADVVSTPEPPVLTLLLSGLALLKRKKK